jgi:hypothetical protein
MRTKHTAWRAVVEHTLCCVHYERRYACFVPYHTFRLITHCRCVTTNLARICIQAHPPSQSPSLQSPSLSTCTHVTSALTLTTRSVLHTPFSRLPSLEGTSPTHHHHARSLADALTALCRSLVTLEELDLSSNSLTEIPEDITRLTHLRR